MKLNFLVIFFISVFLIACGNNKAEPNHSSAGSVTVENFIGLYPEVRLPFSYSDSLFPAKENDSIAIANDVFRQFIPDSIAKSFFAASEPKFFPVGRFGNGKDEVYLLTRGVTKDKKMLLLSAYDKDKKYIAQLPLIRLDRKYKSSVHITIDPKFGITKDIVREMPGKGVVQGHDVYMLNNASKKFMLIMTDSLGEATGELLNPIDTLPQLHKFSGDYSDGKNALISLRDGQRESKMHLFIHIDNPQNGCNGEIKGEIIFTSPTVAEYREGGDPCVLQFIFDNKSVKIVEVAGCGSRLGNLECTFTGTYKKQKSAKTTTNTKPQPATKK